MAKVLNLKFLINAMEAGSSVFRFIAGLQQIILQDDYLYV